MNDPQFIRVSDVSLGDKIRIINRDSDVVEIQNAPVGDIRFITFKECGTEHTRKFALRGDMELERSVLPIEHVVEVREQQAQKRRVWDRVALAASGVGVITYFVFLLFQLK